MKRLLLVGGVVLALIVGVGAWMALSSRAAKAKEAEKERQRNETTVKREDVVVSVVDSGSIDALKAVELKSRVSGRVARILVEEGDLVRAGQLVAVIDPKETALKVKQDRAQLRGAQAAADRTGIELEQRRTTARAAYEQARERLEQIRAEAGVQPDLSRSQIESARAQLKLAQQSLEQLTKTTQPNERTAAESALREAAASLENAQREHDRRKMLVQKGYIAGRDLDDSALQLRLAETRQQSARDRLNRLESQQKIDRDQAHQRVLQAESDLDRAVAGQVQDVVKRRELVSAQAALRQAEANLRDVDVLARSRVQSMATVEQIATVLADSERQLGETEIRAPIDGLVTRKLVQEGELVASISGFSAGTTIVRIEDRRSMRVLLAINEIDVAKLREQMKAKVVIDAFPDTPFAGTVNKIAPASQMATTSASSDAVVKYEVEIWLDRPDPRLRSGMSAKCTLESVRRDKVLVLPLDFIGRDGERRYVEKVGAGGKTTRATVKIGATSGAKAEIVSGVKVGDRVRKPKFTGPSRKGMMTFGPEE